MTPLHFWDPKKKSSWRTQQFKDGAGRGDMHEGKCKKREGLAMGKYRAQDLERDQVGQGKRMVRITGGSD
eukprot:642815-Prymnesium_polylepis.1